MYSEIELVGMSTVNRPTGRTLQGVTCEDQRVGITDTTNKLFI